MAFFDTALIFLVIGPFYSIQYMHLVLLVYFAKTSIAVTEDKINVGFLFPTMSFRECRLLEALCNLTNL